MVHLRRLFITRRCDGIAGVAPCRGCGAPTIDMDALCEPCRVEASAEDACGQLAATDGR